MAEFINRKITQAIENAAASFPVITITGPRQSGKTTLARHMFPEYPYFRVSRFLVGINFRHPNVMPNFAVWKTITYRHWHRWCCQPRF